MIVSDPEMMASHLGKTHSSFRSLTIEEEAKQNGNP